ncbi:hypothetical protein GP486_002352 [Trichoglossum hirsutum]|uniref:GPI inositol-deacylase winged helix domain-containing protein n=1 Tax=Trichoglossum hirsutum TaxID=265104 RepID=A0A9P8LF95_9PEZI|nr:hypothetical protein GP486_002352 [Trichoglossum hirsutum]
MCKHAEDKFLWVSLVLDELLRISPSEPDQEIPRVPGTLNLMYERIINQIDSEHADVVREILLWVVTAVRPLTTNELAAVTAPGRKVGDFSPSKGEALRETLANIDLCWPLVQVREKTQTVHLIHQTAGDYLVATNLVPPLPQANFAISLTCSQHLSAQLGEELKAGNSASSNREALLEYGCAHWPWHARLSGDKVLTDTAWEEDWFLQDPEKRRALYSLYGPHTLGSTKLPQTATLLHAVAFLGLTHILIAIGNQESLDLDTSTRDELGRTPLHWAAEMGRGDTVKYFS